MQVKKSRRTVPDQIKHEVFSGGPQDSLPPEHIPSVFGDQQSAGIAVQYANQQIDCVGEL